MRTTGTSAALVTKLSKSAELAKLKENISFATCVKLAKDCFNAFFDYGIRDILTAFPLDAKDKEGALFWSGPKRAPNAIAFDPKNADHMNFIVPFSNLIAAALGVPENRDVTAISEMAAAAEAAPYVAKKVEVEEEKKEGEQEEKKDAEATTDDEAAIAALTATLDAAKAKIDKSTISPADFEKDDDSNFHIDFINAAANLRATNYQIKNCDRQKTKMIAGKIIPAIATTTAMITGVVTSELYKVVQGYKTVEELRNSFINLALPLFAISEPMPATKVKDSEYDPIEMCCTKVVPGEHTVFDKIVVDNGSLTVQGLCDWLAETYKVDAEIITCGQDLVYNKFLPKNPHADRLAMKIEDVLVQKCGSTIPAYKNWMVVDTSGTIKDSEDGYRMPPLKYVFRK